MPNALYFIDASPNNFHCISNAITGNSAIRLAYKLRPYR